MQIYKQLIENRIPLSNIRYSNKEHKANLIFVPEEGSKGLQDFLSKQIRSMYGEVTVPGIISNFVGKKLSSQKYYLEIKKELPNYTYNRLPNSKVQGSTPVSKLFDTSAIMSTILNITKSRSKKLVFQELIKLFDSVVQDYNGDDDNILFVYGGEGSADNPIFLQFLKYIMNLSGGKFTTKLDAIVYMFNGKHYPLATKKKDDNSKLYFIRNNVELLLKNMDKMRLGEDEHSSIEDMNVEEVKKREDVKDKINILSKELEDSTKEDTHKETISQIKELVHGTIKNNKTFQEKLEEIYKEESKEVKKVKETPIDKISGALKELNKKYNGNITVNLKSDDAVDPMVIVGMKTLGNYNKQEQELNENMDENIKDLLESTLLQDKDLGIELLSVKTKIVDNYNNRYKEYTARIKHKDVGKTTNKPYNITLRTPIVVQGKYTKIGGNNYIMINQLFSAPIAKISPVLVRFHSHFSTTSLELKNTRLTASSDFQEVEEKFITELKSTKMIKSDKLKPFDNKLRDTISKKYNCSDLIDFKYSKMEIKLKDREVYFNFTEEVEVQRDIDGIQVHGIEFYREMKNGSINETAFIEEGGHIIHYKNSSGDESNWETKHINDFIFNIYNKIDKNIQKPKTLDEEEDTGTDGRIFKKAKNSKPFYQIKIQGKKIPLSVFLIVDPETSKDAFQIMELEYKINDKKDNDAKINMNYKVGGVRKYLSLYPKTSTQEFFANGLNSLKISDCDATSNGISGLKECFIEKIMSKFGPKTAQNLLEISSKFVDGATKKILRDYGYNDTLGKVYAYDMVSMIQQRKSPSQYNLDNYRLRMSETVTSSAYKQLQMALAKFKSTSHLSGSKIEMKNSYIMDELIGAGILQYTKTLNPLEEAMLSLKVTKTGIGNTLKSQVNLNRRDTNETYFGIISPTATNEYGGIGVNQTLTNGAIIQDRYGSLKKKEFNNLSNPFENLSPVESLSAFFEYDDTTRRVMGNQQTTQFTQLDNPDVPLVQTGFEAYMPHLVSDRFSKKAKEDGKIESVSNDSIKVKYKSGKIETINTKMVKSRTKRGIFLANKYNNLVQKGQSVKQGDLLSVTDSMKHKKLAIGKNLVVAEMGYLGMNFEDGWVVSDKLSNKYKNTILQKITIPVPFDSALLAMNISEGQETKAGDLLFEYSGSDFDHANMNNQGLDEDDEEFENTMIGLSTSDGTNKYLSPGGKIVEVVVKINNKNVNKQILALHKKITEPMKIKIDRCKKDTEDAKTQEYSDCIGHLENSESLVIGGHKVNQVEIDGAIIEIYIEQDNPVINGSKFTLTSSGGKGTVQYVMEHGKEPVAMETGLEVEFVGTSLSIISRKNPSILLSLYLGKVIYFLNKAVLALAKQNKAVAIKNLVQEIFACLDKTKENFIMTQLNEFFKKKNTEIIKFINSRDPLNNPAFPAIVPPFKNPITIKDIQSAANILGIPLNEKIKIRENNDIVTIKEVPVGIIPVNMLEHFPKAMSSVRGGIDTKRNWVTGQGRSGTKEGTGATKVGLFDMNSLTSKGSFGLLKELHSIKSDNLKAKKQMHRVITKENRIPDKDDMDIEQEDFTSLNMVKDFFTGAGLIMEW